MNHRPSRGKMDWIITVHSVVVAYVRNGKTLVLSNTQGVEPWEIRRYVKERGL